MWCWIKSSFVDLDGWKNGWFWFVWSEFLRGDYLDSHKIGTRLLFAGNLTKQPYFQDIEYRIVGNLTNTDITMNKTLWLGIYPALGVGQLDFIAEKIQEFVG